MGVYVGLDLGQSKDYTALSILERVRPEHVEGMPRPKPYYNVRHLKRYSLGTKYPAIVTDVGNLLRSPLLKRAILIVDATGVGRPVVDMFEAARLKPVAITITSSGLAHEVEPRWWHVAKRDLVSTTQVLLQTHRLHMGERIEGAPLIRHELDSFTVKISTAANDTYEAWREQDHDDLVLSVALAAWYAEHGPQPSLLAGAGLIQGSVKGGWSR